MQGLIEACIEAIDNAGLYDDPVLVELPYTPTLEDMQEVSAELHKLRSGLGAMLIDVNNLKRILIFRD